MFSTTSSSNLVTWENMPQEPSSPTLTNPDLILPDLSDSLDSTPSPQLHPTRPPSPPAHLLRESFRLATSSSAVKPLPLRPPTSYTHHSYGASTDDGVPTPQRLIRREHDMESSSSLRPSPRAIVMQAWQADRNGEADDRHNHWPGFDGPLVESDADGTDDASSRLSSLPYVAGSDEETDTDLFNDFNDGHEELDLEAISSAALSKRAEMILANAKKRLNLMEGNLRGARQSLLPPPRPKYNSYIAPKRPSSISPIAKGQGPFYIPQPQHAARSSATTPSHTRRHSEASDMSQENPTTPQSSRAQRAVSAMGTFRMKWPQTNPRHSMISLRGAKSQETIRHIWVSGDQHSHRSMSRGSMHQISPTLETLKEDEATQQHPALDRAASTTSDLRTQMQTLNHRISTLRERAREEHLKRRSLQNLRDSDVNGHHWDADDSHQRSRSQAADHPKSARHAPRAHTAMELRGRRSSSQHSDYDSRFEDADEEFNYDEASPQAVKPYGNHHNGEDREIYGDDEFEHADQVLSERHEDRADAFDYENFFLHSAMGTYRAEQQRSNSVSSASSEDSVETTRPTSRHAAAAAAAAAARANAPKPPKLGRLAVPYHQRQKSADSISSITTFQTATEGRDAGSDADIEPSEDEDEQGDEATDDRLARSAAHPLAVASKKSNQSLNSSASGSQHLRSAASSYSPLHLNSSGSSLDGSSPLLQSPSSEAYFSSGSGQDSTARIMATFFAQSTCRDKLTPLAQKDEDLLYALTTSIQQVCARLQNAQEDAYETKIWRRRLDAARKILDGVPEEIQM